MSPLDKKKDQGKEEVSKKEERRVKRVHPSAYRPFQYMTSLVLDEAEGGPLKVDMIICVCLCSCARAPLDWTGLDWTGLGWAGPARRVGKRKSAFLKHIDKNKTSRSSWKKCGRLSTS